MVKPHYDLLDWSIKNTKMRIKHMEKHGVGTQAIKEKQILQRQERLRDLHKK